MHLLKGGSRVEENCLLCPETTNLLESLDLVTAQGHAPEAFFSVLQPGTHIPPHYGLANTKLVIHLAIDIPGQCAIKVGGEVRGWEAGKCIVFDDSFAHEAWNRSDQTRVVLITEVWNPSLSELEKAAMLSPMMVSTSAIFGGIVLIAAGIYQLTPYKSSCLKRCREPVWFLSRIWRDGHSGAFTMGLAHGAFCLGCC